MLLGTGEKLEVFSGGGDPKGGDGSDLSGRAVRGLPEHTARP